MSHRARRPAAYSLGWPTNRWLLIAVAAAILNACRHAPPMGQQAAHVPPLPPYLMAGGMPGEELILMEEPGELPWAPPGIRRPWPADEYVRDGGDRDFEVEPRPQRRLAGLDTEDTVAQFDTLDGETHVEPSNRVHIYAPRFASVRQITSLIQTQHSDQPIGMEAPDVPTPAKIRQFVATSEQATVHADEKSTKRVITFQGETNDAGMSSAKSLMMAAENRPIRELLLGIPPETASRVDRWEIERTVDAAITWTHEKAVQVILNHQAANEITGDKRAQATFVVEWLPARPALKLHKSASTSHAQPGDFVDFSLRFENLGRQSIGNVVIVDHLSPRLRYEPGSAASSVDAQFEAVMGDEGSLILRWELSEPLLPGAGGEMHFRCQVQ